MKNREEGVPAPSQQHQQQQQIQDPAGPQQKTFTFKVVKF